MEKQFYHLGGKTKRTYMADGQPHSHNTVTHPHARTHHRTQNTTKASTPRNMRQVHTHPFVTIKLHTVHHTTGDLSQGMAFTREERNRFKEHLLWSSSRALAHVLRWEEAAPEKTLISWFFKTVTERSCSILDQWLLRTVPQGKEESRFFPSPQWRDSESAVSSIARLQLLKASRWEENTQATYLKWALWILTRITMQSQNIGFPEILQLIVRMKVKEQFHSVGNTLIFFLVQSYMNRLKQELQKLIK